MSTLSFEFANPFAADGVWLRGNTHTHTTESDGQWSPERVGAEYGGLGYDFVFVTDHRKRTVPPPRAEGAALLIPGEEADMDGNDCSFHVVILGAPRSLHSRDYPSVDDLIRAANEVNALVIMAHPYWLGTRSVVYQQLLPFLGVEVHNTVCDDIGKANSAVHWDELLDAGRRVYGFAVDDFHSPDKGIAGGWVMVKARENSESAILDSLRAGLFYSTQGPEIHSIAVGEDGIRVECSPVKRINFIANRFNGRVVRAAEGESLTTAEWASRGWLIPVTYVRIECIDAAGRTAWSNPIYLSGDAPKPFF